jgi:subtilisin family serine protease
MIRFHASASLLLLGALCPGLSTGQMTTAMGRTLPGRYLVSYRNGVVPADAAGRAALAGAKLVRQHPHVGVAVVQANEEDASLLRRDPAVAFVVLDRVVSAHAVKVRAAAAGGAADSLYNSQQGWAVRAVGGLGATSSETTTGEPGPWSVTTGAGIRIAILDSGVDATHPDLSPNLALNLTEVDQSALPSVCDDGTPQDQQGHGTWTASLAAGALGAGTGLVAGVAPSAEILNIKVLQRMPGDATAADPSGCLSGQASGLLSWVIEGIDDAVANHADVISMSLGTLVDITTGDGAGVKATFDAATHAAFAAGTVVVAASGNDGFDLSNQRYVEIPAQSRDVVAIVASTNPACAENLAAGATCGSGTVTRPYYSNFGAPLNALAAPGGSYPAGPDADPTQPTGWIRGACSMGKPGTQPGAPVSDGKADPNHSEACFGLGQVAYVQAMGTSASAPLAAGVVALIRAANPTWDAASVVAALRSTAVATPGMSVPQVSAAAAVLPAGRQGYPVIGAPVGN